MDFRTAIGKSLCLVAIASYYSSAHAQGCDGQPVPGIRGSVESLALADGTLIVRSKLNINIDGSARAYHPENASAGALIHLCNAGEVFLPDGTTYHGSVDNATCTGRFMSDVARIRASGWADPTVGMVRWYGVLGRREGTIAGRAVRGIEPVFRSDGSGFYVSPTSFFDSSIPDTANQKRYIDPLRPLGAIRRGGLWPACRRSDSRTCTFAGRPAHYG